MEHSLALDIVERLARIEQKVDDARDLFAGHVTDDTVFHSEVELRVRKLEQWRSYTLGLSAVAGLFSSKLQALFGLR